jgi:fatty-acyl-CoA synthase
MLVSSPAVKKVDLSGWKVIIGGSALPKGMCKAALDLGINIYTGYGMSETCPVLTVANLKPHMMEWDSERQLDYRLKTGFPLPLVDLRVEDESGRHVPRDGRTPGEIVVRTPWLTQGYYKEPEKSEELWRGGRLHTGDVAVIDEEGFVQIMDRLKDVIKSGGEWISSLELESLLSGHPGVSEAAVIGVPDEKWGERPVALVVPVPDRAETLRGEELAEYLGQFVESGRIPKWAVPGEFRIVEAIPKTSVGKIDKKVIRKSFTG